MREILFRGKTPMTDRWVFGTGLLCDGINTWIVNNPIGQAIAFGETKAIVIPETVGQYTGLTDKNGKKIFEGDIIRGFMDFGPAGLLESIVSVGWHDEYGYQWNYFDVDTIEVIGNTHDNPELLKGGADNG